MAFPLQMEALRTDMSTLSDDFRWAHDVFGRQLPHGSDIWLRGVSQTFTPAFRAALHTFRHDITRFERDGRVTTWPRNQTERRSSRNTMGYQLQSERSSSPIDLLD
jgi:hypothetical protein